MTDYKCPDCGCGFPESAGKTRIDPEKAGFDRGWYEKLMVALTPAYYSIIQCPNCGHVIGEDGYDGDITELGIDRVIELRE